ncbi:MAG TPA: 2-amino-4-hydroxy-6-hydroxymethyldihydropteridine diphosphokinase [Chitinivibrionales bacterium]|jgi:2-amino-4-hydroxy-6-hydroxymethyldihydropteridine diphosphokinase|nr:2-amino-4-hydroxy-6-hydroxymethyldihydropteridine diphosphokinase [Chitinivibrionales bacterium]
MVTVFLSLGSNVANRRRNMWEMRNRVSRFLDKPVRVSRLMETEPVGVHAPQPWFLNCVMSGKFAGIAEELLARCQRIENELGRTREKRFAPRTADIDVLMFDGLRIRGRNLVLPHPRMLRRRFCLEGLRDIAPRTTIPGAGRTCSQMHDRMTAKVKAQKIDFIAWRELKNPAVPQDEESSIPMEKKHTYSRSLTPKQASRNALAVGFRSKKG